MSISITHPRIPTATYRLQFNDTFTFIDAARIVPYLHALGITDCYASSYLRAVPGSPHGYDIVDPTMMNPDLGTEHDVFHGMKEDVRQRVLAGLERVGRLQVGVVDVDPRIAERARHEIAPRAVIERDEPHDR